MGGAIAAFGVSGFTGLAERSLVEALAEQPGIPLLGLSAVLLGAGGATLLGPADWRASRRDILLSLPYRLAGLILAGLGLGVLALALIAVAAPARLGEVVSFIIQALFRVLG